MRTRCGRPLAFGLVALVWLSSSRPVYASAIAFSDLMVSNLNIAAANGTLTFSPYEATAFALAQNSLGELDASFDGPSAAAAAAAAVTWASAQGTSGAAQWAAHSQVDLPGGFDASASSQAQGLWASDFVISCPTTSCGTSTQVTFSALLNGLLFVQTDATGVLATTETIFNLNLDGDAVLFHDALLSIGPNSQDSQNIAMLLSNTLTLDYGTSYSLVLRVDSESSGITTVPEPATLTLLTLALGAAGFRHRRTRTRRPIDR